MLMFFFFAPLFALVQTLSAPGMRATLNSVFILVQVGVGGVIGTQLLGILSDAVLPFAGSTASALRWGMSLIALLSAWAALHFWLAGRSVRHDLATAA
jgi:hypothetical protein